MGKYASQSLIIVILCTVFLSGCQLVDDAQARQKQAAQVYQAQVTEPNIPLPVEAEIHCPDLRRDDCGLLVKLNAQGEQVDLNIRLRIDEGVIFLSDRTEAVALDDDGLEGRKAQISLMSQESRKILFPYRMDSPVLPGAYRVEVIATNARTNEVFGDTVAFVYIYLDDEDEYHLLSSKGEYDNRFLNGFRDGKLGVSYKIILEEKEKPRRGVVLVRINSLQDDYAPVVELTSMGGVHFVSDPSGQNQVLGFGDKVSRAFPRIDENGTRIAPFPFVYDKDGQVLEGVYAFVMRLNPETKEEQRENTPVAIMVVSDPAYREDRWLAVTQMDPYILEGAGIGEGGLDTRPSAEAQIAEEACENTWKTGNFPQNTGQPEWTFRVSDFEVTLCRFYLDRYAGKVFLNWREFSEIAIRKNDNISSADEYLVDHEIYWMPRLNSVP